MNLYEEGIEPYVCSSWRNNNTTNYKGSFCEKYRSMILEWIWALSTSIYCWSNYFISEYFFYFLFGNKIELLNFASTNYRFFSYPDGRDSDSNTCIFTNEKTVCFTVRQDTRDFFFGNEIQQVRSGASNGDANMRWMRYKILSWDPGILLLRRYVGDGWTFV